MDDNKIPLVEPAIDYSKIPPIHQKRTVSFVNHFVVNSVSFLNKFALACEERLFEFENKLQMIEAALVLLESRLASVPGLKERSSSIKTETPEDIKTEKQESKAEIVEDKEIQELQTESIDQPDQNEIHDEPETQSVDLEPINKNPVYEKYFKMVNVGVPKPAVKIKMSQEGLDPSLLDNPQRLVPKAAETST